MILFFILFIQLPCWDFGMGGSRLFYFHRKDQGDSRILWGRSHDGLFSRKAERVHDINIAGSKNPKSLSGATISGSWVRVLSLCRPSLCRPFSFHCHFQYGNGDDTKAACLWLLIWDRAFLPMMALAVLIATLNSGGSNLTAIGISLERENFDYLKGSPIWFEAIYSFEVLAALCRPVYPASDLAFDN